MNAVKRFLKTNWRLCSGCGVGMLMKLDCIGIRNMKLKIVDELLPSNPSVNLCNFDVANYDSFVQNQDRQVQQKISTCC